jgi:predicted transcriptional regulator
MQNRLELQRWRETQEAIDAAERGKVVSGEEVFAWLDTWGRESIAAKKPTELAHQGRKSAIT